MSLWFIVWVVCVLFMLAIVKGGHRVRGSGYEHKLYSRYKVKPLKNVEDLIKKEGKKTARTKRKPKTRRNQCQPIFVHK